MWKKIRIAILLAILLFVAIDAWRDQNQNWKKPISVLLHPINADGSQETEAYIQHLNAAQFASIAQFLTQSAQQYQQSPYFMMRLGRTLQQLPPEVPKDGGILSSILWSIKFRYYAWQQQSSSDPTATVTLYLNYYSPKKRNALQHSTALERGRIGSINLFSDSEQELQNDIVIAHELLHAFGATDKYNLSTGQPIYPQGYADIQQYPLLPQHRAELMGGYIPMTETTRKMPQQLDQTVIGRLTAQEIGWVK